MELFASLHCHIHQQSCPMFKKSSRMSFSAISTARSSPPPTGMIFIPGWSGSQKYNEVCHGNFVPSKVIISAATGEPYIIDWFHATQGNAAADAALTYLLLRMRGRREEAEQYLALFCEKAKSNRIISAAGCRWWRLPQTVVANARSRAVLQRWIDDPAGAQEMETEVNEA